MFTQTQRLVNYECNAIELFLFDDLFDVSRQGWLSVVYT